MAKTCEDCGKVYGSFSGYWSHRKKYHDPSKPAVEAITIGEVPKDPAIVIVTQNGKSARLVVWQLTLAEVVDVVAGAARQALQKKGR